MDPYICPYGRLLNQMATDIRAAKKIIGPVVKALNGRRLLKKPLQTAVGDKFLQYGIKCDFDIYLTERVPPNRKLSREVGRALHNGGFQPEGDAGMEAPTAGKYPETFGRATLAFKWSAGENSSGGRLRLVIQWQPLKEELENWHHVTKQLGKNGLLKIVQKL